MNEILCGFNPNTSIVLANAHVRIKIGKCLRSSHKRQSISILLRCTLGYLYAEFWKRPLIKSEYFEFHQTHFATIQFVVDMKSVMLVNGRGIRTSLSLKTLGLETSDLGGAI